jgi:transcriptional regulator of arginine metabolism
MVKQGKLSKRQIALQELVATHDIQDQAMFIELLHAKHGISTNQAVISRDLRKLGIHKRLRGTVMVYDVPQVDVMNEILRYALQSVHHNENMIVIKTVAGTAALVADYLDAQHDLAILATLAGENVVFVVPVSAKNIETLFLGISHRMNGLKNT